MKVRDCKFILILMSSLILLLTSYTIGISFAQSTTFADIKFPVKVSTRGQFDNMTGELLPEHNKTDYVASEIPGLQHGVCPKEIAIIVHGWSLDENKANERFVRANMSLEDMKYQNNNNTVVGYSWDANLNNNNWNLAKSIAKDNGPKLAQFILDFKIQCPNTEVRLVSHSLGARVVLSTLDSLYNNQKWNETFKVTSVTVMGAAVDNEEISKDLSYIEKTQPILNNFTQLMNSISEWYDVYGIKSAYGKVIETEVNKFYNLFDPKDKALIREYAKSEYDNALGLNGAQIGITLPSNYNETNVQNEILALPDSDADGKDDLAVTRPVEIGDNHGGYFGFTNITNGQKTFVDNGAMDVVVEQWRNETNNISDM
jgi:hypothetical protein